MLICAYILKKEKLICLYAKETRVKLLTYRKSKLLTYKKSKIINLQKEQIYQLIETAKYWLIENENFNSYIKRKNIVL